MNSAEAALPDTSETAWQLNEAGLSVIPLGSPFESPPEWFQTKRCGGDGAKATNDWPKTSRVGWKQYQDQAPSDADIEQWTIQWPFTNWAIVTGYRVIVIDADSSEAVKFIESGSVTRTPLRAITSKGKHYYYQVNPNYPIRNAVKKNKIDIRGAGGYVVAPGSTHADGTQYRWETDDCIDKNDLLELPVLTADDMAQINSFNGSAENAQPTGNLGFSANQYAVPHDGSNLAEGQGRNNAAASMAGQYIRQGMPLQQVKNLLDQWNSTNTPPLLSNELNTTIASVARTHLNNNPQAVIPVQPLVATPPAFQFSHVNELLMAIRAINWLIKGFIEMDSLCVLFGEPSCGKSFVAIDLACCVATGKSWHGKAVKKKGAVFYIAGEGFNGISRRIMAWQLEHGYNLNAAPLYVSQCSAALTDPANAQIVSAGIEEAVRQSGGEAPSLIVIDTLARNFGPGDENGTKEMNVFIHNIDHFFRQKFGCCVLVVHHTGVGNKDRARGNSALKGAADAEYAVVKNDDELKISAKKMKDAEEPAAMDFQLKTIKLPFCDEDGEPQLSCVLQYIDPNIAQTLRIEKGMEKHIGNKQKQIIQALADLISGAKSILAKDGRDPELARIEVKNLRDKCIENKIIGRNNVKRTLDTLIERGFLAVDAPFITLTEKGREAISHE